MAITSQVRLPLGFAEVFLDDWQDANLLKPSVIKPVFATLEQGLIIKKLGQLSAADRASLRQAIKQVTG